MSKFSMLICLLLAKMYDMVDIFLLKLSNKSFLNVTRQKMKVNLNIEASDLLY